MDNDNSYLCKKKDRLKSIKWTPKETKNFYKVT